jgi:hypothetical protein
MTHKVSIVHWAPVEMYPPAINLVRFLADTKRWDVSLHTTWNRHGRPDFEYAGVTIHRSANPSGKTGIARAFAYSAFQAKTTSQLLRKRPDVVMYFEPMSSLPVLIAHKLGARARSFIHHHEYHEPEEFLRPGMRFARTLHRLEQDELFADADWISHTNGERLKMFLRDNPKAPAAVSRVLPNLPPRSWATRRDSPWTSATPPFKLVYVGSLSRADTYVEEAVGWITSRAARDVTLDIYAYNLDTDTRSWLATLGDDLIRFHPKGVEYDELPRVLSGYHAGLILYKAHSPNYEHNASNKLFEYLACGLDVLFPSEMLGVQPYARDDRAPRVLEVDFRTGHGLDIERLTNRGSIPFVPMNEFADDVLGELETEMSAAAGRISDR